MFFSYFNKKHFGYCLLPFHALEIAKLRAWMELNVVSYTAHTNCYVQMTN